MWQSHLNTGKEFEGSDRKCFDHHAISIGYNVINAFYSAIQAGRREWGSSGYLGRQEGKVLQVHSFQIF